MTIQEAINSIETKAKESGYNVDKELEVINDLVADVEDVNGFSSVVFNMKFKELADTYRESWGTAVRQVKEEG